MRKLDKKTINGLRYHAISKVMADSRVNVAIYPTESAHPVFVKTYAMTLGKAVQKAWEEYDKKREQIMADKMMKG